MRGISLSAGLATAIVVAGLVGVLSLGAAGSASAHDFLESTTPAADSTVTEALSEVALTFNEPPLDDSGAAIAIEVHDPSGANTAVGSISIVNSTLSTAVEPTSTGHYTVLWQTISADGHPVSGEFGFEYAGPVAATSIPAPTASEGASVSRGAGATPSGAPGSASPTAAPAPAGSAAGVAGTTDGGLQLPVVLIGVGSALAVLLVVAVVVAIVLRRRSRAAAGVPRDTPEDDEHPTAR